MSTATAKESSVPVEQAAWRLPSHLVTLVRKEAVDRRMRPAHVVAEIFADRYRVPTGKLAKQGRRLKSI